MEHGDPLAVPGTAFAYADTGYVLLGEIIERTTGTGLAEALRTLLDYDALGLDATYLESLEPVPAAAQPRTHAYFLDIDRDRLDPSVDLYGGGGLVAPMADVARFYRALLAGEVFEDPETLETMLDVPEYSSADPAGMGIYLNVLSSEECWSHQGFWGTVAATCPGPDITVTVAIGQAQSELDLNDVAADAIEAVNSARIEG